jgi:hypothetical protein
MKCSEQLTLTIPWANMSGMLDLNKRKFQVVCERSGQPSIGCKDKYAEKTPKIIRDK